MSTETLEWCRTPFRQSQVLGVSRQARKRLEKLWVHEFWHEGDSRPVRDFAGALAVAARTSESQLLLRYDGQRTIDAESVGRTGRDRWYLVHNENEVGSLLATTWSEMLETVQLWSIPRRLAAPHIVLSGDAHLASSANWLLACGADGLVAQFLPVHISEGLDSDDLTRLLRRAQRQVGIALVPETPTRC